jgi:predicted ATPase
VASQERHLFAEGVYFVSLAPVTAEFVIPAIANAIRLTFYGAADPQTQLFNYLREKQVLLVLDNLEHLLLSPREGPGVEVISRLLQQTSTLKLLTTSRERLNLQGEWVFEIQGLPVPPADEADTLENYSAGMLFLHSAQRARVGFVLPGEERAAVARICRLLEGLPLGIELAAAWARTLSCPEIAQEIERNMDFLAVSARDVPERHRSLRAVFDYSWQLLAEDEGRVLMRLAVFRGGFRREAAEQVAGATLPLLSALVDKSLLHRREAGRYDLHELIRQYALEKLRTSGQVEATCDKQLSYFTALAAEARVQLRGPQQADWYNRLEQEHDNLRAVLAWAFAPDAPPERVEQGLHLVTNSYRYWQGRGHAREAVTWLERGLQAGEAISAVTRGGALNIAGWLVYHWDDMERASRMLHESVALHRRVNDEAGVAMALDFLGDGAWREGDFAAAKAFYAESLAIYRQRDSLCDIGLSLYSAGRLHVDYGYYQEAEPLLHEGLALLERAQDWRGIALCHSALGRLALLQGNLAQAAPRFGEALHLNQKLGRKVDIAECLGELAMVAAGLGQEQRAVRLWSAATALLETIGVKMPATDPLYLQAKRTWLADPFASPEWLAGQAMSLEEAIAYALAGEESISYSRSSAASRVSQ